MSKVLGFIIGIMVSAVYITQAQAQEKPITNKNVVVLKDTPDSQNSGQEEETFAKLMNEIIKKSFSPNLRIKGVITPTAECIAEEGSKIYGDILFKDTLSFNFGKPDQDPVMALVMDAANRGLVLRTQTTIGENCSYLIKGNFYQYTNGQLLPSNLILKFKMGLTGQLLSFRVTSLDSKFESVNKGDNGVKEYKFLGRLEADQELSDFKFNLDLDSKNKEGLSAPAVTVWEPMDVEIIFQDGQFKIPMKAKSDIPNKSVKKK